MREFTRDELRRSVRPTLGQTVPLEWFRLLRLNAMRDVFGEALADTLYLLGRSFGRRLAEGDVDRLAAQFEALGLGKLRLVVEEEDRMVFEVDECATCSGLPDVGENLCWFEAGLLAGALEMITGRPTRVRETACASRSSDVCKYEAELV